MKVVLQLLLTFLLNASWQIGLVAAFALLCDWLLRGTAARYRHGLWVVALLLSLALPALSCARLLKTLLIAKGSQAQVAAVSVGFTSTYSPELDSADTSPSKNPVGPPQLEGVSRTLPGAPIWVNRSAAEVLLLIYALLLLYRGSQLFRAWQQTRTIMRSAYEFAFLEPVQTIIQTCQTAIGVKRVRILCSTSVPVPITVGILKQLIILPERLLSEVDDEVLTSAIGHELVHVARRDYLVNLIYEFIYLPLSFHPAAALVRRRIKQTRELCCDESVAKKLLKPEIYARSLVRLIGSAPIARRLAASTTIGINESDILEVRIMSLLNGTKLSARRKRVLLIAGALLLTIPCVAATSFALNFDIDRQEPRVTQSQQSVKRERQDNQVRELMGQAREREELKRAAQELKEQIRAAPESKRAEIEAQLRVVQQSLELHERMVQQYQQNREEEQKKLEELRAAMALWEKNRPADEARYKELRQEFAKIEAQYPGDEAKVREAREKLAQLYQSSGDRKARVIYRVDPEYPEDARAKKIEGTVLLGFTIDHDGLPQSIQVKRSLYPSLDQAAIETVRKWRFEPALKNGQPVSTWVNVEVYFALDQRTKEEVEKNAMQERLRVTDLYEMKRRKDAEGQEREERARKQAELTRGAVLSMDRAIQIATSQVPGKVLACSLGRDGDKLFYHVVIISGDGDKSTATYVWVSAIDGQILKTEKEERREKEESSTESEQRAAINGGVLNGKATSLPQPVFPAIARQAHASGTVNVEVLISEGGEVVAAHAVSGHPLLQASAVAAARQASFTPTRLNGEPVRVSGILVYNFVAQ